MVGTKYEQTVLTEALVDDKLIPALRALDEVDPTGEMEYAVESRVGFGDFLPDVFGSTDLLGRIGDRAVVLDWKFVLLKLRIRLLLRVGNEKSVRQNRSQLHLPVVSS